MNGGGRRRWWRLLTGAAAVVAVAGAGVAWLFAGSHSAHHARHSAQACSAPLFGLSANWQTWWPEMAQFGHLPVVRWYFPGLPPANAWTSGPLGQEHTTVVVSFKANPSQILSGAANGALAHFFRTAPTGHPIYYSYYHEPEDNIYHGEFSLAAYKAAWAKVVALADAAHNPQLRATLILMSYDLSPASHYHNFRDYLPAGHIITTLGWDAYPAGTIENRNVRLTPPANFMGAAVAASKRVGLAYGFAEFALARTDGRPAWLHQVGGWLAHSGAKFATYFDSLRWPAQHLSDPASVAAWRAVITRDPVPRGVACHG